MKDQFIMIQCAWLQMEAYALRTLPLSLPVLICLIMVRKVYLVWLEVTIDWALLAFWKIKELSIRQLLESILKIPWMLLLGPRFHLDLLNGEKLKVVKLHLIFIQILEENNGVFWLMTFYSMIKIWRIIRWRRLLYLTLQTFRYSFLNSFGIMYTLVWDKFFKRMI